MLVVHPEPLFTNGTGEVACDTHAALRPDGGWHPLSVKQGDWIAAFTAGPVSCETCHNAAAKPPKRRFQFPLFRLPQMPHEGGH